MVFGTLAKLGEGPCSLRGLVEVFRRRTSGGGIVYASIGGGEWSILVRLHLLIWLRRWLLILRLGVGYVGLGEVGGGSGIPTVLCISAMNPRAVRFLSQTNGQCQRFQNSPARILQGNWISVDGRTSSKPSRSAPRLVSSPASLRPLGRNQ